MKKILSLCCVLALSTTFFSACGGSDESNDGSPDVNLGVSGDKVISNLTIGEQATVCNGFQTAVLKVLNKENLCKMVGFIAGAVASSPEEQVTACNTALQACDESSQPLEPSDFDMDLDCEIDETGIVECNATISEVEDCFQEMIDTMYNVFEAISCDNFDNLPDLDDLDVGTACIALAAKCPNLMDD